MTTVRDIMTTDARCINEDASLTDAAAMMRDLDVGSLPICGNDDRLKGIITDRDIVIRCIAEGGDPTSKRVSELAQGALVTVGADDDIDAALDAMKAHQIRRLPVLEDKRLVGIVSQADIARKLEAERTGRVVDAISQQ